MIAGMRLIVSIGLAALFLAGCTSAADWEARDHAACLRSGTEIGTEAYTACRSELSAKREAADRAQARANMRNYRRHVGR
jgi:hypothetical protein